MKKISLFLALVMLLVCLAPAAAAETTADLISAVGTTQAFTDEAVPEEDIQTILRAGLASESAINQQPWYFVAITDKDVMAELSSKGGMPQGMGPGAAPPQGMTPPDGITPPDGMAMPEGMTPPNGMTPPGGAQMPMASSGAKAALGDSPLAILVYMDESTASPNPSFDCGLAAQNMYIAAASLGYGVKVISSPTITLNGENHDQICESLGVDPSLTAVAVLLVGKKDVDAVTSATTRADFDSKISLIG